MCAVCSQAYAVELPRRIGGHAEGIPDAWVAERAGGGLLKKAWVVEPVCGRVVAHAFMGVRRKVSGVGLRATRSVVRRLSRWIPAISSDWRAIH
jgi:hypothetical protein